MPQRVDGRQPDEMRPLQITPGPLRHAEGSALVELGATRVLCAATVMEGAPPHLRGTGKGWLTAEYAMLPRSSAQRITRDGVKGKISGRSHEIQRLIGRSLRSVFRMDKFGERTMIIDCDVLEADGGTRTASITGGFVALVMAVEKLRESQQVSRKHQLVRDYLAATSVGIVEGRPVLDLCYLEDAQAETDMNIAMTGSGDYIEVQGTAEAAPFRPDELGTMLELAAAGCRQIVEAQQQALGSKTLPGAEGG